GINFWIGNNPTATGYPKMPPGIRATQEGLLKDSITLAEEASGRKLKRFEVSKFWSERANAYISANRFAWMRLMTVKFGNLWTALLRSAWVPATGYVAVAVGAALFVSTSRHDYSLWSLDHYKAGIRATEAGDLDRAQRNLETAFAYVQDNADINFALGNLWL